MATDAVELRPTIDRTWLEAEAIRDPVSHTYALWDLEQFPQLVRFVSAIRRGTTVAYLLLWHPPGQSPFVHWVGEPAPELTLGLPPRPLIVLAPEAARHLVEEARGPARGYPTLVEVAPAATPPPPTLHDSNVRPLRAGDRAALASLAQGAEDATGMGYTGLDPARETIFGGFDGENLVGAARAGVRRPTVWLVSGVYVRPESRGREWGRAVTRAVMLEAARAGAPTALFVREDRLPARAVYERLGFHPVGRRVWLDCGLDRPP
jgi:ribosomal protein S18 acetylase RimI-like enzyme